MPSHFVKVRHSLCDETWYDQGQYWGGVTKAWFVNFSVSKIFDLAKAQPSLNHIHI